MKKIPLSRNRYAWVSNADYDWAMQWKWSAGQVQKNHWYAMRTEGGKTLYLHIELMKRIKGSIRPGYVVDHRDGDGLDNTRRNIREVTRSVNTKNNYKYRNLMAQGAA